MKLADVVRCPKCASSDVVYSCEPKCCFNHVCSNCRTTFQLITRATGRRGGPVVAAEPESCEPTAACDVCKGLKLAVITAGPAAEIECADCGAMLQLAYDEIS